MNTESIQPVNQEQVSKRKELVGIVLSDKMQKTIVVQAQRRVAHSKYTKVITVKKKFYAHDENELAGTGDTVRIRESRPLSRLKRWSLVEVIRVSKNTEVTQPEVTQVDGELAKKKTAKAKTKVGGKK